MVICVLLAVVAVKVRAVAMHHPQQVAMVATVYPHLYLERL
jgi:hypothetical protein